MPSLFDTKFAALGAQGFTGDMQDRELQWLQANGATSPADSDAWLQMLDAQGFGPANGYARQGGWLALLLSLGYTGAISDAQYGFWTDGGTFVPPDIRGEQIFTVSGTFVVPADVTSVCAVAIGRGGFNRGVFSRDGCGGGGLGWQNNVAVTPGQNIAVTIDNTSSRIAGFTARGDRPTGIAGGGRGGQGGGNGGAGGIGVFGVGSQTVTGGSGGAGGYSGNGGRGGDAGSDNQNGNFGAAGNGGGGGGGGGAGNYSEAQNRYGGNGGGTGIFGQGSNGAGGTAQGQQGNPGGGGSGGSSNATYGGGGSPNQFQPGPQPQGAGVVRILWGAGRAFPSTDVGAT